MPSIALTDPRSYDLLLRLSAAKVDSVNGIITGATVAKAGVPAIGKFVMVDKAGKITRDEEQMHRVVQCFTDQKTLDTLMTCAAEAGKRTKCREDHNDTLAARVGFCQNFQRGTGDAVSADIHVMKAYPNRAQLFEIAGDTPELIGLSIDARFEYELSKIGDQEVALMRVRELGAVDVVDAGAITPDGLLLKRSSVDKPNKVTLAKTETQPTAPMADTPPAAPNPNEAVLAAIANMGKMLCDAMAKIATPPAPAKADEPDGDELKAAQKKMTDTLSAITSEMTKLKRTNALLGLRPSLRAELSAGDRTAEDIEKLASTQKDYLSLVADHADTVKCKRSEAHIWVQKNHRDAYADHLKAKGVYDPAKKSAAA